MPKTIGVIGLGSIGMRHLDNVRVLGHKAIGLDNENDLMFQAQGSKVTIEQILGTDAVIIASPTATHAAYIDEAWKVGKPVFCEKPVSDKLTATASYPIMVGYNLRFHSCVKQAKQWIDDGLLGNPLWANFTVAQFNLKYAESVILNWSHEIDLALYLLGPGTVVGCSARLNQLGAFEDMADIMAQHDNACRSTIHLDYLTHPEIRQTIIVGSGATIIMDLVNRQAWLRGADGTLWDHLEGQDSWDENYVEEIKAFIDRLDGKETIGCTGEEGLRVLQACLDAKKLSR